MIMMDEVKLTPIQARMLQLLSDGLPHSRESLLECLQDDHPEPTAHAKHLAAIRLKIRLRGEDIICEYRKRRAYYRHVRLLNSPYDGQH
jgi:hypothetical protein